MVLKVDRKKILQFPSGNDHITYINLQTLGGFSSYQVTLAKQYDSKEIVLPRHWTHAGDSQVINCRYIDSLLSDRLKPCLICFFDQWRGSKAEHIKFILFFVKKEQVSIRVKLPPTPVWVEFVHNM